MRATSAKIDVATSTSGRGNIVLLVASIAFAALACEIAARMMLPAPLPWLDPQVGYRADPSLIFGLIPNQRGYSADKPVTINERGLRGAVIPYERTPGLLRILFLGDSITFGYGVNDTEVVTERVRVLLGSDSIATEVINSAVPSYNMRQEVTYLETEGIRYDPDWVVVGVCWNDISDKSEVIVDNLGQLTTAGTRAEPLTTRISESPLGYRVRNVLKRSRFAYGALAGWRALMDRRTPDAQTVFRSEVLEGKETSQIVDGWKDVSAQLRRLKILADARGFRPLVVAFPIPMAVAQEFPKSSYPARLEKLAAENDLRFLDLTASFRQAYHGHESLFIAYDGDHPNASGHALAARDIKTFVAEHMKRD